MIYKDNLIECINALYLNKQVNKTMTDKLYKMFYDYCEIHDYFMGNTNFKNMLKTFSKRELIAILDSCGEIIGGSK
jgi:hypothetical protein